MRGAEWCPVTLPGVAGTRLWKMFSLRSRCLQAHRPERSSANWGAGTSLWRCRGETSLRCLGQHWGKLFDSTITDEGTWTLEDRKLIRIILMKSNRNAANCWASLLEGEYSADPLVQDQMQKKLTLERFQRENPGFDFSGAELSGNYSKGGPDFSCLEK
ncbi:nudC domain-containing protein 2 isoform X3 [Ascaphus truei]|uniref:nudC domain-containing protein 2 isoform X3 n=1 Tax=Ascaphus truei TaxID=8439 RepID=UPI003F5A989F